MATLIALLCFNTFATIPIVWSWLVKVHPNVYDRCGVWEMIMPAYEVGCSQFWLIAFFPSVLLLVPIIWVWYASKWNSMLFSVIFSTVIGSLISSELIAFRHGDKSRDWELFVVSIACYGLAISAGYIILFLTKKRVKEVIKGVSE